MHRVTMSLFVFMLFFGALLKKFIILFTDYCLVNRKTLGNNASPVANMFFYWRSYIQSAWFSDLCTKVVPLQSVTKLARAGKKFPLMQEFGDFLHK